MKKNIKVLCMWLFLFVASMSVCLANNAMHHWEFAGWYGGGCYPNLEFDSKVANRVYLVSDVAGIWRSDNLGEQWSFINNGLKNLNVALLAVSPLDSNVLYAGTKVGLFVSRDAGQLWESVNSMNGEITFSRPQNYRSIALSKRSVDKICVGTANGGVFCSDDRGKNWNILNKNKYPFRDHVPITAMAFSSDENFIYVASQKGLVKYSFKDKSWFGLENSPAPITDFYLSSKSDKTIYVASQDRLFVSSDEGASWIATAMIPQGKITRVSVDESVAPVIAVVWEKGWNGGVLLSQDQGKTWNSADRDLIADNAADPTRAWARAGGKTASVKINPFDSRVMFRTDWWGVWRSDDGGKSWQEKIAGAPNSVGSDISINSKDEIFVATMDDGLLKSSDGGKSYKAVFPVSGYDKNLNGHVWRVLSFGEDGQDVIATSSPWDTDVNQVLLSSDGGVTVNVIRDGLPKKRPRVNTMWEQGYARALAIDPNDLNAVYLGIDGDDGGGLFVSKDGGKSWRSSQGQPASKRIYNALAVDPTNSKRILWGASDKNGGVYLSEDQGSSWQYVFSEMNGVFDIAIDKDGTVYASGNCQGPCVYVSKNHGKKWQLLKKFSEQGTAEAIVIDRNNLKRMAVSIVQWGGISGGKVYFSNDGGKNWQDINGDLPFGTGAAAMSFSHDGQYLYISRYAGSVYKINL